MKRIDIAARTGRHSANRLHLSHQSVLHSRSTRHFSLAQTHNSRIRHWPLGRSPDAVVQAAFIGVVAAIRVRQEQGVDVAALEEFGEVDPVLQGSLRGGAVLGILSHDQWMFNCEIRDFGG